MSSNTYSKPRNGSQAGYLLLIAALVLLLGTAVSQAHAHLDEPQEPACVLCGINGDDVHTNVENSQTDSKWLRSSTSAHPAETQLCCPQLFQGLPRAPPAN